MRQVEAKSQHCTHLFEQTEEGARCVDDHETAEADLQKNLLHEGVSETLRCDVMDRVRYDKSGQVAHCGE